MTVDRRLRSGDAPLLAMACVWLLTAGFILLAALLWPQPAQAQGTAGFLTAALSSGFLLAVVIFAAGQTAWRLLGREACLATCLLLPLNPAVLCAFSPGTDAASAWPLAATALAVAFLSGRVAARGAALAGAAMAAGVVLQPGLWPVAGAIAALLFARWLRDGRAAAEFSAYLKGGTATALPLLLVQHLLGTSGTGMAAALTAGAGLAVLLVGTLALQRATRLAPGVLAGAMAAVAATALGAAMLTASMSGITPDLALSLAPAPLTVLIPAILALGACLYLASHNEAWLRRWWRDYSAVLVAALLAAFMQPAVAAVAALLAVMPLGWLAAQLLFMWGRTRRVGWWPAPFAAALIGAGAFGAAANAGPAENAGSTVIAYADTMLR